MKHNARPYSSPLSRLSRLALALALIAPPNLIVTAQSPTVRRLRPALRTLQQTSPPASNLPDLDGIRSLQPAAPAAPTPVPSTACSPLNPGCQSGGAFMRSPYMDRNPFASDSYQLARNLGAPTLESFMGGARGAVTDAPDASGPPLARKNKADSKAAPSSANLSAVRAAAMMQGANTHSLSLNGTTDYLEVPNSSSINLTSAFTAEAWVKLNASTGSYQSVMERFGSPDASGNNGGFILRVQPDGRLEFFVLQSSQSGYPVTGHTLVTSGAWHHIAATTDGSQLRLYLDGQLDGLLGVSAYPQTGTSSLFIGRGTTGTYGYLSGQLDEARLTASSLYDADFTPESYLSADSDTRGLWKFDGQTTNDSSGNGNTAIVRGAPSYSTNTAALSNHSVSLDGATGRVSVPYSTSLDVAGPFTAEAWFKIADNDQNQYLASCLTTTGGYILMANDGMPQLYVVNAAGQSDFAIASPPVITFNQWHHLAGVADGSQMRVYLDGTLVASKTTTIVPGSFSGSTLSLGAHQNSGAPTSGLLDEVRVSAGAVYAANFTPKKHLVATASTRGLWKFDGQTLQDASGNANNGSLVGGASYSTDVPASNQPPTAGVTAPANNSTFANDSTVNITATASDTDGTISKVEFFRGATKLGEDATSPYSFAWDHATAGSYPITAKATDNAGAATTSSAVNITVTQPSVTVAASDANASEQGSDPGVFTVTRTGGTSQPLTVGYVLSGTATNGTDYATLSGAVTIPAGSASQTVTVTPVDDAAVEGSETGTLTLSAGTAYAAGVPASATVTLADNDTNPPTISTTLPTAGTVFTAPASITINANATDNDGTVSKVEFYQGTTKLGEDMIAPYSFTWNNVAAGAYSLTAVATDNAGATGSSTAVNVVVNGAPAVSVTAPAGGTIFTAPASVTVTASASDSDGTVSKVEFFRNGTKIGEDATAPYSYPWSGMSTGSYSLTAVATDNLGAATTSAPVSVTINGAPTVSLTAPAGGAVFTVPAGVTISANASDADGMVAKVEFYQGQTKLGEVTTAPYNFTWGSASAGTYSLTARATDNLGATTTSAAVTVTVNGPPIVALTSPSANSAFAAGSSVQLTAAASDGDGTVAKVEFYRDGVLLGEDVSAPYSFAWTNAAAGSYSVTAKATDNSGASAMSAAVAVSIVDFTAARLDAVNSTGSDDLFSRNFSWGVSLVRLPGRAGLDLDVSLSYNSLVWLRSGSAMLFDPDRGFPTPGFRLGFPVVQGKYLNTDVGAGGVNSYVLVTPSGSRVELRQKGATNVYESADSSYTQLVEGTGALVLYPGDGSALTFSYLGSEYQLTGIQDRNGNYVTVSYNSFNRPDTVTDTLGREVKFNYDSYQNPISITQAPAAGGQPHAWATFGYESRAVDTSFSGVTGLSVFGAVVGRQVPVLAWVGTDDGTRYSFTYNARGQVTRITRAAQNAAGQWIELSYAEYTLPDTGADCPRFTQSSVWAKDWNDGNPVTTTYSVEGDRQVVTLPDGTTRQKVIYATTGWQRGLVVGTETWSGSEVKRSTTTAWEQDETPPGSSYQLNPRVTSSSVSDSANSRRTEIEYLTAQESEFRLPKKVSEFKGNETTPLRHTETTYELGYDYTGLRHIVGLVAEQRLYDGAGSLQSKTGYAYDTAGCVTDQTGAVRHDDGYDANVKRGALCSVTRYRAGTGDTQSPVSVVAARMTYDSLGSSLSTIDAGDHKTSAGYQDNFTGTVNHNTYAYPTSSTDADQNALPAGERLSATVAYDFDTGRVVKARDVKGAEAVSEYDAAGRTLKVTQRDGVNNVDKGYTRFVYSRTQDFVASFSLVDVVGGFNVEAYSAQVMDGMGRVRASARNHPHPGPAEDYSAQLVEYNNLGQAVKQYNPVEVNSSWAAAGDDLNTGWVSSSQTYDWKGRPLVTTNADGTTKTAAYDGCGCAGGEVVTLTDEMQRRQKVYHDVLGRVVKTEALNKDDNYSIYSTTTSTYNARDQVTHIYERQGSGGTVQDTAMTYDGYGRLATKRSPAQSAPVSYDYDADDVLLSMTDPRGVVTAFGFTHDGYTNKRHLVNTVTHSNAPPGVPTPSSITNTYDAAGNRTSMTDGTGSHTYTYNPLSQLTSETRQFANVTGAYTLTYAYTAGGQLKSMTDWAGMSTAYAYDAAARLSGMTGSGPGSAPTYLSNVSYRAWGAVRDADYGDAANGTHGHVDFNSRLLPSSYSVSGVKPNAYDLVSGGGGVPNNTQSLTMAWSYDYYADGRVRHVTDATNNKYDRLYDYDHVGRLKEAYTGREADGLAVATPPNSPFRQSIAYDVWGNMTSKTGRVWGTSEQFTGTFTNDRKTGWTYDEAGNVLLDDSFAHTYDAAGQQSHAASRATIGDGTSQPVAPASEFTQTYDGDGQPAVRTESSWRALYDEQGTPNYYQSDGSGTCYYVRSSALGGAVVSDLTADGAGGLTKRRGYFYAGGSRVANRDQYGTLRFEHSVPGTNSSVETREGDRYADREERDPGGGELPLFDMNPGQGYVTLKGERPLYMEGGDPFDYSGGRSIDGMPVSEAEFNRMMDADALSVEYVGLLERTAPGPNQRGGTTVPVERPVHPLGLGMYEMWVPSPFRSDDHMKFTGASMVFDLRQQRKSGCATFVDDLISYTNGTHGTLENMGRLMANRAKPGSELALKAGKGELDISGFQEKYIMGRQNGWAMAHIQAMAGLTLVGDARTIPGIPSITGTERANIQWKEDRDQRDEALKWQAQGLKTVPGEYGGRKDYPLLDYIAEQHAALWDDGAGTIAANTLGRAYRREINNEQAGEELNALLCK